MCGNLLIAQFGSFMSKSLLLLNYQSDRLLSAPQFCCWLLTEIGGWTLCFMDHYSSFILILYPAGLTSQNLLAKKHVWIASRQEVIKHPLVGGIVYYNHKTTLSLTSHSGESKSFITFHQMSTGTQFFFFFTIHIWQVEGKYLPYR